MEKVDTYSGILNCLSKNSESKVLSKIINAYKHINNSNRGSAVEKINYIYINVVVSCVNLTLIEEPFHSLVSLLCRCLKNPTRDIHLPLYFIAVLLLWPQPHITRTESGQLRAYISHLNSAYQNEMKQIYNGKKATVHFFLGAKPGYQQFVHLDEIKTCINASNELFASQWVNGSVWKNIKVQELLCRVTGKVKSRKILVHTCNAEIKVEVSPLFQSQLQEHQEGSIASCLIGFSMEGPVAIDISKP